MSAFILSDADLCKIITFAGIHKLVEKDQQQYWLEVLLKQNYRSVNTAYGESTETPPITFVPTIASAEQVAEECESYVYQSDNTSDFSSTSAFALVRTICDRARQQVEVERKAAIQKAKDDEARWLALGMLEVESRPSGTTHCILAELQQDASDSMTDYFNSQTVRSLFLEWSKTSRNQFPEMRKAASTHPETAHLGTGMGLYRIVRKGDPDDPYSHGSTWSTNNGQTYFTTYAEAGLIATEYAAEDAENSVKLTNGKIQCFCPHFPWGYEIRGSDQELEHRENYSGGKGYYLAQHTYSGWHVRKVAVDAYRSTIAIALGRSLQEAGKAATPTGCLVSRGELVAWYRATVPGSPERERITQLGSELMRLFNEAQGTSGVKPPDGFTHEAVRMDEMELARMRSLIPSSEPEQIVEVS